MGDPLSAQSGSARVALVVGICPADVGTGNLGAWDCGWIFPDQYPSFRSPHPINLAWLIAVNVTVVLGTVAMMVAWREEVEQTLRDLAMKDPLTGLLNRRGF
ncbi:MAG: GGDEF domain-containing protein [Betaproteobacteria bacterium]|nr:GGDEF domain-containing protein [Betaproteobacteria bacterium]